MAQITLDGITKRYPDGYEAVKNMSLEIEDGEFVILVGPSGCGKSTALRMIAGLEDITDGELRIGDDVVNDKAPKDRDIAMVFQNYALYPHMTVRDNMGFALKLRGADKSRDRPEGRRRGADPRPRAAPRPPARQPVGRPAPARGHGPRDRARPGRLPHGRAALEPRRQAPRADAHRGGAHPAASRHHHRLRDARPDRGHDARRPRGRDALGRAAAGGQPDEALQRAREPVRGRLHRLAGDELHARHRRGRQREAADRRRAPAAGRARAGGPRRAASS